VEADNNYTPLRLAGRGFVPEIQSIVDQLTKSQQKSLHGRPPMKLIQIDIDPD
jgi:hypothetical protein